MDLSRYEANKKYSRILMIAGIGMMFENIKYATIVGIIMIIIGFIINCYYNKKIIFEKKKDIIIKYIEENLDKIVIKNNKKPEIIKTEIKVINTFGKKYIINNNFINIDPKGHINKIIYYNINYDKITLFLNLYMFVKKYEIIMNLNHPIISNKLLLEYDPKGQFVAMQQYYHHYYNIIAYISNLNDETDISIAMHYMTDDYNNNAKQLYNLLKDIEDNKSISNVFNNIIHSEKIDLNLN